MGLLDPFLGGMGQDEQMMLAAGLLRGNGNLGANLSQGLLGAQQQRQGRTERELEQIKLQQMKQQLQQQEQQRQALAALGQSNPQIAQLAQIDPKLALDRAFPQPKLQFAPNGQVVDMNAMQPGQNFAKQPDWMNPEYIKAQSQIRAAGRPQVTVDTRQESEFNKAVGKQQGEDYSGLMKSDAMASGKINKLTRLESLLASSGNTGKLTPAVMELKAAAESLGFKVDPKLPFQQAAQALSNEIALELRNPSGGAGMPGALSDKDREFLVNMVPNLAKTAGGNKILIDTMKKLAQREKEIAKLARDYRKKTGRFDEGFYDVLSQYSAQNPLFEAPASGDGWSATQVQ